MAWFGRDTDDNATKEPAEDLVSAPPFVTKYGTWCRTCAFQADAQLPPTYWEAYQQKGAPDKWTVNEVGVREKDGEELLSIRTVKKNLTFQEALHRLASYERGHPTLPGERIGPDARDLGGVHYEQFGEREGFVFDASGAPHLPENEHSPGPGNFKKSDIERARRNAKEAEYLPLANRTTGPLAEIFNAVSHVGNFDEVLAGLDQIGHIDAFFHHLRTFRLELDNVIRDPEGYDQQSPQSFKTTLNDRSYEIVKHREYGYDGSYTVKKMHMHGADKATVALDEAYKELLAAEKKGAHVDPLVRMLHKFDLATQLIWGQALFHAACTGDGSHQWRTDKMRELEDRARKICRDKLGITSEEEMEKLKQAMIQGDRPDVPEFITTFGDDYAEARAAMKESKLAGSFKPDELKTALAKGGMAGA